MDRRAFLAATAATSAAAFALPAAMAAPPLKADPYGGQTGDPLPTVDGLPLGPLSNSHYPDSHIESLDERFKGGVGTGAVERVATGFRWAEGPAYFRAGRYLLFSDVPNNRMMRLLTDDNHLSVFRSPSQNSNGNTIDPQGRLVTCEHSGRRVTRTELDGTIAVLADQYKGRRFNSPNDVIVASNGSIWFSDPTYGIAGNYEGLASESEQGRQNVYRIDAKSGLVTVVVDDFFQPNGLCFSPDEKKLYIIDSGAPKHIRVFAVDTDRGTASHGKVFADHFSPSLADGMRCDVDGNIWCSIGWGDPKEDGVRCYSSTGDLLGKIHLPETCANLVFGGRLKNRLYMCASTSIYACYVNTQGTVSP